MDKDYKEYYNYWVKDDILILKEDFIIDYDKIEYKIPANIKQLVLSNSIDINTSLYHYKNKLGIDNEYYYTIGHKNELLLISNIGKYICTNTLTKFFPKITHLCLPVYFNNQIDILPSSLTHLILTNAFNQELDNLPLLLIFLNLSYCFNKRLDNLPYSLIYI